MMPNASFDQKKTVKYLLWTFGIAWAIQAVAALIYHQVSIQAGQMAVAAMMFVPTLGVLLAGQSLKDLGWKPDIRRNWKPILLAWFGPAALTALGAALYFLAFPGHFDLSGDYVAASAGAEMLEQMEAQGLTYPLYVVVSIIGCVTYAPVINTLLGLGEEIGWRGFLYPQLKAKFGQRKGWLLGGFIWGAWHWPLIWWIGYEYGAAVGNAAGYVGFPEVGMLVFLVFTFSVGILCDWLYEKSGSIWLPALCHGTVNAAATLPLAVCLINTGSARLLGPAPMGLLAGLPLLIAAAALMCRKPAAEQP